jgi:type II secretion system protein G
MRRSNPRHRGFTLIEILIVVVILGILAAIVIPQFTNASQEATTSAIRSQLQSIRGQVELYRVRNGGVLPTAMTDLMDPPNGEAPYFTQEPVAPANWTFVFGDNTNTAAVTETVYAEWAGGPTLPPGIDQAMIDSW